MATLGRSAGAQSARRRYEAFIFVTGGVTLALEVLSSRIMTPYFGVSLFIWSGILSITLAFLAIGYWAGGRAASGKSAEQLLTLFLAGPAIATVAIGISALVYPALFPWLADRNLVLGSFLGGAVLLAIPIVTLSAMNPLLVALRREDVDGGDAGAGTVFFVSTVGSVAGVLVTAFVFIPGFSNYTAVLMLGLAIGVGTVALAFSQRPAPSGRGGVVVAAALGVIICLIMLFAKDSYLRSLAKMEGIDLEMRVAAQYSSLYGTIKVVQATRSDGTNLRMYLQDGLVQNIVDPLGMSQSLHTHALEELGLAYAPHARSALVLGLAAGLVPMRFKAEGIDVTVVDINPRSIEVAQRHFGFDPSAITVRVEDARTYVRACDGQFDIVVVDLFHGDGTPDYLMTQEFFADVARCLNRNGIIVMNTFYDNQDDHPNRRVLATLATAFGVTIEFRSPSGGTFLVATNTVLAPQVATSASHVPLGLIDGFRKTLATGRLVPSAELAGAQPFTDQQNSFSFVFARAEMEHRKSWAQGLPPGLLVN
jgi:predicted membrane-bound spermidine synthase